MTMGRGAVLLREIATGRLGGMAGDPTTCSFVTVRVTLPSLPGPLGGRLTVGHAALDRRIGVRIPASQPFPERTAFPREGCTLRAESHGNADLATRFFRRTPSGEDGVGVGRLAVCEPPRTQFSEDFDVDRLRYHKLIIMCDADVDALANGDVGAPGPARPAC